MEQKYSIRKALDIAINSLYVHMELPEVSNKEPFEKAIETLKAFQDLI